MTGPVDLEPVVEALGAGEVAVVPTDTVYGLAARLDRPGALARIFEVKGRPAGLALPVLIASPSAIALLTAAPDADPPVDGGWRAVASDWPPAARRLAARFWPGPLTLVVPAWPEIGALLGGNGRTVGIRRPDHPVIGALCRRVGPLAVTSANRHGEAPCVTAAEAEAVFGGDPRVGPVVDGGICDAVPSTVVDCTVSPPRCLRRGAIAPELIEAAWREA